MDNLLTVAFEAHHPDRNRHRRYRLTVVRDLFGDWSLTAEYGRVGTGGQVKRFAGPDQEGVRAEIRARLLRRLSAPRRIGCPYRVTALDAATGFDAAAWLPAELLARFDEDR